MIRGIGVILTSSQGEERKKMRFSELVEHVTKKPIPPWKKHLLVEVTVTDEEGEDVEVKHDVTISNRRLLIAYVNFRCRSSSCASEWSLRWHRLDCRGHDCGQWVGWIGIAKVNTLMYEERIVFD